MLFNNQGLRLELTHTDLQSCFSSLQSVLVKEVTARSDDASSTDKSMFVTYTSDCMTLAHCTFSAMSKDFKAASDDQDEQNRQGCQPDGVRKTQKIAGQKQQSSHRM